MRILGIDPGLYGAIAVIDTDWSKSRWPQLCDVCDIAIKGEGPKCRVDVLAVAQWIKPHRAKAAFIERAGIFPKQGRASGFVYGRAVGALEATTILCGVPLHIIEALSWKRHFDLIGKDKAASLEKVLRNTGYAGEDLLRLAKHHNRAEAIMIAVYGAHLLAEGKIPQFNLEISQRYKNDRSNVA